MANDERAEVAETRRQVDRLQEATRRRHTLTNGTPEYDAAMDVEERLLLALWHRLEGAPRPGLERRAS
jgi:hypothetical protein